MNETWYVIVNPTSGNGTSKKLWPKIESELLFQNFKFKVAFTEHEEHSKELVQNALNQGFKRFISVGGDGSLHNIVNGIFNTPTIDYKTVKLGVIPIGTGNDWVRNYNIPINYKKAIHIIKQGYCYKQDIGKITLLNSNTFIYFNNIAGIGFDGHVVNKVHKYKHLGFLAYITGALLSLLSYQRKNLHITFNKTSISGKSLMLLIGIGKYSGGGMQLTENVKSDDGLFDVSYIKNVSLWYLIKNIGKVFNGEVTQLPVIKNYKTPAIKVSFNTDEEIYIQADGELLKTDCFTAAILPRALQFIVPKSSLL